MLIPGGADGRMICEMNFRTSRNAERGCVRSRSEYWPITKTLSEHKRAGARVNNQRHEAGA